MALLFDTIINDGHSFYSLHVTPRRLRVGLELHTVPLHGLSFADFSFATAVDGEFARHRNTAARFSDQRQAPSVS